jgi:hypothetical protein
MDVEELWQHGPPGWVVEEKGVEFVTHGVAGALAIQVR